MARLVDVIEEMIKELVDENNGSCTINRSQLAERANCVPSQVTYVLTTRFGSGNGYIVESRRGGGGQITITRAVYMTGEEYLNKMVEAIGPDLTQQQAKNLLVSAVAQGVLSAKDGNVIMAAVSDRALARIEPDIRSRVRADIMKNAILALIAA
ncbi:transcriptional regulator CtsR [Ruminococcaceae bacterium YRB3002]|nr:transcriptional regulator CtsR [Ruminococcaceae bacterium YRB3002]